MSVLRRLFSYTLRYRRRFFLGVVVSFFVAILNALSLTAMWPLFEALGDRQEYFAIPFSQAERRILGEVLTDVRRREALGETVGPGGVHTRGLVIPKGVGAIDRLIADRLVKLTHRPGSYGLK